LKLADLQAQQRVQEGKATHWVLQQGTVADSRSGMRNLCVRGWLAIGRPHLLTLTSYMWFGFGQKTGKNRLFL